jgi:anaerobic magnesium-protoporphyrin IX monomethyl ester cyclase
MAQILLTHSYFLRFDPKELSARMPYPPLGTLYAASMLRSSGYDVAVHDVMFSSSEVELTDSLNAHRPSILVIYDDGFNYLTKMCLERMRQAAFAMSQLGRTMQCRVVVCSSDASDHYAQYLDHGADYVIRGEGEHTLNDLVRSLLGGSDRTLQSIEGLVWRDGNTITQTPSRKVTEDLDSFPFPSRDLINLDVYRSMWKKKHRYFSLNIVTTRGCPFHCNWCAKPIYGQVYHTRSPQNVVQEMKLLQGSFKPDHLWFADDIFGLKPGWIREFDEEVNRHNARVPFKCLSRADLLLKEDNIRHLRSAGCETVWLGAESGSQKILDAMDKGTTVGEIHEATRLLHRNGIRAGFFLQYGYPGETKEDIDATFRMVRECRPDEIGISISYPLPGTRFYERVRRELGHKQNWTDSGDLEMMFQGTYSPDFYRTLHKITHKQFQVWKSIDLLRGAQVNPRRLNYKAIRALAASAYHALTLPRLRRSLANLENAPRATATGSFT